MSRLREDGNLDYEDPAFEPPPPPNKPTPIDDPDLFAGGLTKGAPAGGQNVYSGADGNQYTDDPDMNSVTGFIPYTPASADGAPPSPYQPGAGGGGGGTSYGREPGGGFRGIYDGPAAGGSGGGGGNTGSNIGTQRQGILDRLNRLADQYSSPVTGDDPQIRAMSDTYAGNISRSMGQYREMAAERAHAEGTPTGAFDAQLGNAMMAGGRASGEFEQNLIHDQMMSNRNALSDTLKQSAGLLSDQDQADIQRRIASIDEAMRGRGLDIQSQLGNRGLDIQQLLGEGNLANSRASVGNQSRGIDNQNNQFYDDFAYRQAHDSSNADLLAQFLLK